MPRTKIIATLGPASSNQTVLRKMFRAGLDVVRLNFSHGSHETHGKSIEMVRRLNHQHRRHIRIMQDLEGFRIRVGRFEEGKDRQLEKNSTVWLSNKADADGPKTIPFDYEGDLTPIKRGQMIFINDGNLQLQARDVSENSIKAKVIEGGILSERKGINFPGADLKFEQITNKDREDIEFAVEYKPDFIALSFVRDADDINAAAALIKPHLPDCKLVAKVESTQALSNIDSVIDAADGIMIARGDMGVAVPVYQVPIIQKKIIKKCNWAGKFVITATQMLEHMTESARPTRAEVTDVANAIIDGTDYVMLSGETAVGNYPDKTVDMMNQIIRYTEQAINSKLL